MPEPTLAPATVATAALVALVAIIGVGLLTTMQVGVLLMAVFAFAGAVARVVTPAARAFAVRRRAVDVTVLVALAIALGFLGLTTSLV